MLIRRTGDFHARQSETTFCLVCPHRSKCGGSTLFWADAGPLAFGSLDLKWATHTHSLCLVKELRGPCSRCTLHVTVSRAIGCRFLSGVVVTSPTVITCSNGLTEEALWEGVLLPALLPACSLRSVFFSGRWPGPVGSFRSTAPHHNPPFLELATTSSPSESL